MKKVTYAMFKPSIAADPSVCEEVRAAINAAGLHIEQEKAVQFSRDLAENFYAEHKGKHFFEGLVSMLSGAPVVALILSGEDAVKQWRELIGPTNPSNGHAGQLRYEYADGEAYAAGSPDNGFHGSASAEDAEREIALVFSETA